MKGVFGVFSAVAIVTATCSMGLSQGSHRSAVPAYVSHYYMAHFAGGVTFADLLGDKDKRTNLSVGLEYFKPEPVFRFRRKKAELLQELYIQHSRTINGARGSNEYSALGYLFGARYNWHFHGKWGMYADLGAGIQYNNHR